MLSVNSTFALIAPIFLVLLGTSQIAAWLVWRRQSALLSQGSAFVLASVGMLVQIIGWKEPFWTRVLAFASCYLLAAALVGVAMAQRLEVRPRWSWVAGMWLALMSAEMWWTLGQPNFVLRVYCISIGAMLLVGLPFLQWQQMRLRNQFDSAWRWVYVALIVVNVISTFKQLPMMAALTAPMLQYQAGRFIETAFWLFLYVLIMAICMGAAGCLLSAVMQDVLAQLAIERSQDPLTQILNRRGFDERAERLLTQAPRSRAACSYALLLCDIDHFKQINDRWGHGVGDEVLRKIAWMFQTHSRAGDVVARQGGEEFVVLLKAEAPAQAMAIAQRMCDEIAAMSLPEVEQQRITVSIGVAMLNGSSTASLHAAMQEADQHLYAAKHRGRNCVVGKDAQVKNRPVSSLS